MANGVCIDHCEPRQYSELKVGAQGDTIAPVASMSSSFRNLVYKGM